MQLSRVYERRHALHPAYNIQDHPVDETAGNILVTSLLRSWILNTCTYHYEDSGLDQALYASINVMLGCGCGCLYGSHGLLVLDAKVNFSPVWQPWSACIEDAGLLCELLAGSPSNDNFLKRISDHSPGLWKIGHKSHALISSLM